MFEFNPLSPDFQANPYAYYDGLRSAAPVFYWDRWNSWFLSNYDDCVTALKDARLGREAQNAFTKEQLATMPPPSSSQMPLIDMEHNWMLLRDAPDHTRLRGLVHKVFTPRTVERLRSHIEEIVTDLLNAVEDKGHMDIVEDLAFPLPVTVIAELIGIPPADRHVFQQWSHDLAFTLEMTEDPAVYDQGAAATVEFSAYIKDLIAQRRAKPEDDLLSALVAAEEAGDKLNEAELIATVSLLLVAGHETTVNLIGSGMLALLRHPDQFAKLKTDPSLTRNATEEMLRYDSPVQLTSRFVMEDMELAGHQIKRGQQVVPLLGAANRDPKQFNDPNTFDISRVGADKHIGFGNGVHFCLGAPLARLEGTTAIRMLVARFPNLTLATDNPRYRPTFVLRGLASLPVTF